MLKNKIIVRKIRNIVILFMAIIIMFGAYKNIDRSRAEDVIEIGAIALDNYGYLEEENFILEAKQIEEDLFEIELPESINSKKVNQIIKVTLEDFVPEEVLSENAVIENASTQNTTTETTETPAEENTTSEETTPQAEAPVQESTASEEETTPQAEAPVQESITPEETTPQAETPAQESTTSEETTKQPETPAQESTPPQDTTSENVTEEINLEIVDNKIYLTKAQIDEKQINIEVVYDIAILEEKEDGGYNKTLLTEKNEEERKRLEEAGIIGPTANNEEVTANRKILYSKILKYEDEENKKLVELKGYLPENAELQIEEVSQEKLKEIFGDKEIDVAYDIKIIVKNVTQVPVDEANPESEPEEIVEIIEINPEEFGETCEVSIKDVNIEEKSEVYHVKEDNTYEQVNVKDNSTEGNISFEAQTFSIYAVSPVAEEEPLTGTTNNTTSSTQQNQYEVNAIADSEGPIILYEYSSGDIDKSLKTVKVVFKIIDDDFKQSTLTIDNLTIKIDGAEPVWKAAGAAGAGVTKALTSASVANGIQYTLTLTELEQDEIESGKKYLNYSGIVTVGIPANVALDNSGNYNSAKTLTVGVNIGSGSGYTGGVTLPSSPHSSPYLPEGYTYVTGTVDTGYVVQDPNGNQFVWVPVPRTSSVYRTAGTNITNFTETEIRRIYADLQTYTSAYTDSAYEEELFSNQAGFEATGGIIRMLKSVYKNGGFYIGRYETGYTVTNPSKVSDAVIKANAKPMLGFDYDMAYSIGTAVARNFCSEGYMAGMMWGINWNLTMKYLETSGAATQYQLKTDSTNLGNYLNTSVKITKWGAKYTADFNSWNSAYNYQKNPGNPDTLERNSIVYNWCK